MSKPSSAAALVSISELEISGLLLAGGLARRMQPHEGASLDKGLLPFRGRPLAACVIERLRPQVSRLVINANRHLDTWRVFGYPIVQDLIPGHPGPLAGLHAAFATGGSPWWVTVPCDTPFLPLDLVTRLRHALRHPSDRLAVAVQAGRWQPVFMLAHESLLPALTQRLQGGHGRLEDWLRSQGAIPVPFDDEHAFCNLNTPQEWAVQETETAPSGVQDA